MTVTVSVEKLCKAYKRRIRRPGLGGALRSFFSNEGESIEAISGLTFTLHRGERVALIGENGAGKSTAIKMLTGVIMPTSGGVTVLGLDPWRQRRAVAAQIGVVFGQRPQLLWDIPVQETFSLLRTMYRIPDATYAVTYREAIERLDLGPLLPVQVRKLSLGQRMRCDLAASLLHAPAVAFLDEPTIGLDVVAKEQVREFVREMQRQFGTTLVLTTHDLKDITEICDRLILLDRGKLLFDGSIKAFENSFATQRRIIVELEAPVSEATAAEIERDVLALGATVQECSGHRAIVAYEGEATTPALAMLLLQRLRVTNIVLEKADLESIVAKIYRRAPAAS